MLRPTSRLLDRTTGLLGRTTRTLDRTTGRLLGNTCALLAPLAGKLGVTQRVVLLLALMGVAMVVIGMGLGLLTAGLFFRAAGA